jgi:hypothetical protein
MTDEKFDSLLVEADAENIATAWRSQGLPDEHVPLVVENCLRYPGMIDTLRRRFSWDDETIARAMFDPHRFADEVLADSEAIGREGSD